MVAMLHSKRKLALTSLNMSCHANNRGSLGGEEGAALFKVPIQVAPTIGSSPCSSLHDHPINDTCKTSRIWISFHLSSKLDDVAYSDESNKVMYCKEIL
jgi:hypothetical protein